MPGPPSAVQLKVAVSPWLTVWLIGVAKVFPLGETMKLIIEQRIINGL